MKLLQSPCKKEEYKTYTDLFLEFEHEGHKFRIAVRPCFWRDMGILKKVAKE